MILDLHSNKKQGTQKSTLRKGHLWFAVRISTWPIPRTRRAEPVPSRTGENYHDCCKASGICKRDNKENIYYLPSACTVASLWLLHLSS